MVRPLEAAQKLALSQSRRDYSVRPCHAGLSPRLFAAVPSEPMLRATGAENWRHLVRAFSDAPRSCRRAAAPYQEGRYQVNPEPKRESKVGVNKYKDQHTGEKRPQYRRPWLRNEEPPHVDPSDKEREPGKKKAQDKKPQRYAVMQSHRKEHGCEVYLSRAGLSRFRFASFAHSPGRGRGHRRGTTGCPGPKN